MTTLMIASCSEADERALRDLHTRLARALADLETQRRHLAVAEQRHHGDIALIGERLIQEAGDRAWCPEYDQVIADLNRDLSVTLPDRERDFLVTTMVELRLSVTATSEDEAEEKARELVDRAEERIDAMADVTSYPQGNYDVAEDDD